MTSFGAGVFSIVDSSGNVLDSGPLQHWNLCAYTTELWAIIVCLFFRLTTYLCTFRLSVGSRSNEFLSFSTMRCPLRGPT